MSATLYRHYFRSVIDITISTQSVRDSLHAVGVYARRQMMCVRLTASHRLTRTELAVEHVHW